MKSMKVKFIEDPHVFETYDLGLASTLLSFSFPILSIDRGKDGRCCFQFLRTQTLQDMVGEYWNRKTRVEPQRLLEVLRSLKARIYAEPEA